MKNKKIVLIAAFFVLVLSSCGVRFVDPSTGQTVASFGYQPGRQQQAQGRPQTSLKPYYPGQKPSGRVQTGTKKHETAYFEAMLWNSEDEGLKLAASRYAAQYFENKKVQPSDEEVSAAIGHKCKIIRVR